MKNLKSKLPEEESRPSVLPYQPSKVEENIPDKKELKYEQYTEDIEDELNHSRTFITGRVLLPVKPSNSSGSPQKMKVSSSKPPLKPDTIHDQEELTDLSTSFEVSKLNDSTNHEIPHDPSPSKIVS